MSCGRRGELRHPLQHCLETRNERLLFIESMRLASRGEVGVAKRVADRKRLEIVCSPSGNEQCRAESYFLAPLEDEDLLFARDPAVV